MAYTNNNGTNVAIPNGAADAASNIDTYIQDTKKAYNERLLDIFGIDCTSSTEQQPTKISGAVTFNGAGKQANQPVAAVGNITGATTLDFDVRGNYLTMTLTGNVTFTLSNARVGTVYTLIITQDGTGGRTITWPASVRWPGGVAPTINTTANRVTIVSLIPHAAVILGAVAGTNYNVS